MNRRRAPALALLLVAACSDDGAPGAADAPAVPDGPSVADGGDASGLPDAGAADAAVDAAPADAAPPPVVLPAEFSVALQPGVTVGDVVGRFAPVWYHDTAPGGPDGALGAKQDYYMPVDYDGELRHDNNWEDLGAYDVGATIYYAFVATGTHYIITWSQYHARDWEDVCSGLFTECHEGDMESVRMVLRRAPDGFGAPVVVISGAHGEKYIWTDPGAGLGETGDGELDYESDAGEYSPVFDDAHTHVRLYTQEKGHGPIPCRAREVEPFGGYFGFFPDGVRCKNAPYDVGFRGGDGIVFRYALGAATPYAPGMDAANTTVDYAFAAYLERLWPHRHEIGDGLLFGDGSDYTMVYTGARGDPFAFPEVIGFKFDPMQFLVENSGNAAWSGGLTGSSRGDLFFDPAYAIAARFGAADPPPSLDYVYNPYVFPGLLPP